MNLRGLLKGLEIRNIHGSLDTPVRGASSDSRKTEPGDLFICVRGLVSNGHDFIPAAIARGAAALLVEDISRAPEGVTAVAVPDTRAAMARVASNLYDFPTRELGLIGVTGTNGKTTTAFLIRAIMSRLGGVGLIGTVHNIISGEIRPVERTTPEALDLQRLFREMVNAGDRYAVIEASSHALELHRVDLCEFDVGVFTNLTRDHLDFHGDFASYLLAKAKLFEMLGESYGAKPKEGPKFAVLNADDKSSEKLRKFCRVPVYTYGIKCPADIHAGDIALSPEGSSFTVYSRWGDVRVNLALIGEFNVYNALAAFAVGIGMGIPPVEVAQSLDSVKGVPGRFELVPEARGFSVVVDYAHTPDGLENVLHAARRIAKNRVITVFGCGGDRDKAKRPMMGEIAARLADISFITSDNPRSEDPEAITREVEDGAKRVVGARYRIVVDREQAILEAIDEAQEGDLVLIAGKGHENYQVFHDRVMPFDDREVVREALARRCQS